MPRFLDLLSRLTTGWLACFVYLSPLVPEAELDRRASEPDRRAPAEPDPPTAADPDRGEPCRTHPETVDRRPLSAVERELWADLGYPTGGRPDRQ